MTQPSAAAARRARAARRRAASRAGFTLAEVLLTLLIMSGILLSITKILQAARNARDTIHNYQENQLAGPAIMDMIERDLRGMITYQPHAAANTCCVDEPRDARPGWRQHRLRHDDRTT